MNLQQQQHPQSEFYSDLNRQPPFPSKPHSNKYFLQKSSQTAKLLSLETSLQNKIITSKSSQHNITRSTLEKMKNLSMFLSKLNPSTLTQLNSSYSNKKTASTQTDEDETSMLHEKLLLLEKENQTNITALTKYKKDLQLIQKENTDLKSQNDKLITQNKQLQSTIDELSKTKIDLEKEIQNFKTENQNINNTLLSLNHTLKELEQSKKLYQEKIDLKGKQIQCKLYNDIQQYQLTSNKILFLVNNNLFTYVTNYLDVNDICNLRLSNKQISINIYNNNALMKRFYTRIIKSKNQKIINLNNFDFKKEYLLQNAKLEQLIKEYVHTNKLPGKELYIAVMKCLSFLNKDVKIPLGYNPSKTKGEREHTTGMSVVSATTTTTTNNNNSASYYSYSLFGGLKSMLGYGSTSSDNNSGYNTPSKPSSRAMSFVSNSQVKNSSDIKNTLESFDKIITDELTKCDEYYSMAGVVNVVQYEFDFQSEEEIKMYLNKFLKANFPVDKLTSFIKEVCSGFGEMLFYSQRVINEIKELDIVKNALNERFRYFSKLAYDYEKKNKMMQHTQQQQQQQHSVIYEDIYDNNTTTTTKDKGLIDEERKQLKHQIEIYKMHTLMYETKSNMYMKKYEDIKNDFDAFRNIYVKENRQLKFQLTTINEERNHLLQQIESFKKYCEQVKLEYII